MVILYQFPLSETIHQMQSTNNHNHQQRCPGCRQGLPGRRREYLRSELLQAIQNSPPAGLPDSAGERSVELLRERATVAEVLERFGQGSPSGVLMTRSLRTSARWRSASRLKRAVILVRPHAGASLCGAKSFSRRAPALFRLPPPLCSHLLWSSGLARSPPAAPSPCGPPVRRATPLVRRGRHRMT